MKLFIARLNPTTTAMDLQNLFAHYGAVESVKIIFDHNTGKSKCYGFVEMPNNHEAHEAINELDKTNFQDNTISVTESQPPELRSHKITSEKLRHDRDIQKHQSYPISGVGAYAAPDNHKKSDSYRSRNFGYRGTL